MAFINYVVHLAILMGIYSIVAVSLNFALGFTGLINLGHVAFYGIGAYGSALLAMNGFPLWASMFCGALFAMVAGLLLALPTTRLKGDYLALATLGLTFIVQAVARNWTDFTRGALGLPGLPKIVSNNFMFLGIVLVFVVVTYFIFWQLSKSRFGKTCEAVRDDELAAKMLGKNAFAHKVGAMAISAFFAGIAGALFAHYITFIDPTIFSMNDLILMLSMVIVGGLASVKGSLFGTVIIFLIPEPLRFIGFPSHLVGPLREIIFALVLLLILIYRPRGLFGKVDLQ